MYYGPTADEIKYQQGIYYSLPVLKGDMQKQYY